MFWMKSTLKSLTYVVLFSITVESLTLTMKADKAGASGHTPSLLFVTNKMCPFAQKAWIALEAAELPYKFEQVSLYGGGGKPSWFMKLNPKGQVPVLVVNDDSDKDKVVLADSDLILDEMGMVMDSVFSKTQSTSSSNQLLVTESSDGENYAKISAFRSNLREFLPIGKSAVLGGNKERMWSKLRELDAVMDTKGRQSYIIAGTNKPTIADCAGFPFLWRIDQEFGSSTSWESNGCHNIPAWLEFCKKQPPFEKSIQRSSWWWWW